MTELLRCVHPGLLRRLGPDEWLRHSFLLGRGDAHAWGIHHLTAAVYLANGRGEFLVQRRALTRPTNPGKWTSSAAGHADESSRHMGDVAHRELAEEVGVEANPLSLRAVEVEGAEISFVYFGEEFPDGQPLRPSAECAPGTGWKTREELERLLAEEEFTDYARRGWRDMLALGPRPPSPQGVFFVRSEKGGNTNGDTDEDTDEN